MLVVTWAAPTVLSKHGGHRQAGWCRRRARQEEQVVSEIVGWQGMAGLNQVGSCRPVLQVVVEISVA